MIKLARIEPINCLEDISVISSDEAICYSVVEFSASNLRQTPAMAFDDDNDDVDDDNDDGDDGSISMIIMI